jgi:uncharacterized membrane protein
MKRSGFSVGLAIVLCAAMSAVAGAASYSFQRVVFPNDTFTQLLGINDAGLIAGYHGMDVNKGFRFSLPNTFINENFPGSLQTQVIGINNSDKTSGFYIDAGGVTHGFTRKANDSFTTVDYPDTGFNQLLSQNNHSQAAGYYADSPDFTVDHAYIYNEIGGVFLLIVNPLSVNSQATGINDLQEVCGFYVDSSGTTHGFLLNFGTLTTLDFPGSAFTQALGLNNVGQLVGFYQNSTADGALTHGFVYNINTGVFQKVDEPNGPGTTIINGINNQGQIVGFFVGSGGHTNGFIGTPIP